MYKLVQTQEEEQLFQSIYQQICHTESFEVERSAQDAVQYLFYHEGEAVGTIEFAPYRPEVFTTVDDFDFTICEEVQSNKEKVWEIDKVGFLESHRKKGLIAELFEVMYLVQKQYQFDYVVCLYEYRFFRLMRGMTPHAIQAVGDSFLVTGEKNKVVPTLVDARLWVEWFGQMQRKKEKV